MRKDVVTMVLLTALAAWCLVFSGAGAQTITVGSKDFTEQVIMGHMVADLLEAHGFATNRILGLGGDDLVFTGMHRGEIDIWMSYSGTIYSVLLGNELVLGADPDELYRESQRQLLERHNLVLLEPIGFNNTYVFVADRSLVEKHGLTKVSDLIPIADTLTLGGSILFMGDRQDGIRGVEAVYGMKFRRTRAIESGLLFQAMQLGQVDLIVDDGGHKMHQQITSFRELWPKLKDRGLYIVEDTHTSYWPGFGGGFREGKSFIEFAKDLIDRMHSWYTEDDAGFPLHPLAREIGGIRFYNSLVVIEKRLKQAPVAITAQDGNVVRSRRMLKVRGRRSIF